MRCVGNLTEEKSYMFNETSGIGDFGCQRMFNMQASKFLLMTSRSTSLSDDDASSKMVWIFFWCGVRLSPLGTSATNWRIVPSPDDR
jgi:hypothetical protein